MNIAQVKQLVHNCIEKKVYVPFLFIGSMGIGKSKGLEQVTQEDKIGWIDLRLAQQEPGDLIGLPRADMEKKRTVWLKPQWWPEEGTTGLLSLEELNRAPTDVRQAVFQLILDRKLHTHTLPDNWFICSSINPDAGGYYQVEKLDPAMIRRFCVIKVEPDIEVWSKWWRGSYEGYHADLIAQFLLANKGLLALKEEFEIEAKPTPDGYRMLHDILSSGAVPAEVEAEVIRGLIGNEAAVAFVRFSQKNYARPVSGKEILQNYSAIKEKVLAQENDAMYVTLHDLIALIENQKGLRKGSIDNLAAFMIDMKEEQKSLIVSKLPSHIFSKLGNYPELVESMTKLMAEIKKPNK